MFQSNWSPSPPTSPNKLRSRTARLALAQAQATTTPSRASPPPPYSSVVRPLPRPPVFSSSTGAWPSGLKRRPSHSGDAKTLQRQPKDEPRAAEQHLALQLLSHPRLPLVLVIPVIVLITYIILVAVQGSMHSRHLALERPWTAAARILEARAHEAKWNSVAAIARIFARPEPEPNGIVAQLGRWLRPW